MFHIRNSTNCASAFFPVTRNSARLTGKLKHLGPALPGFRSNTPFF
jgi:hypothetical protein